MKNKKNNAKPSVTPSAEQARFIHCPTCRIRTRLIHSGPDGVQTRRCQNGHTFTFDKWIADRAGWGFILSGRIPNPYGR
jgi:hypothetical protein